MHEHRECRVGVSCGASSAVGIRRCWALARLKACAEAVSDAARPQNKICLGFAPMDLKTDFTGPDPNTVGVGAPDPEGSVYIPEDLHDDESPRFIGDMEDEEI